MKRCVYVIQGVIKNKKQKQENVGITAFEALQKGKATIDKPIYYKECTVNAFTNNIDESVFWDFQPNAINLCDEMNKRFLDFDFKVIKCTMTLQLTPIGT